MTFGSEQVGPLPFVHPGAFTSPAAFDQPPAYHAQSTPAAERRSPIVACVCSGSFAPNAPHGCCDGCRGVTGESPPARFATGDGRATVSGPRATVPVGLYSGYFTGIPFESMTERRLAGASGYVGACAAIRNWWLRYDPPNAAWKKLSRITYFGCDAAWRYW